MDTVYYIILWVVLGMIMGFIARAILPGEQKIGLVPTLIVGALGAFLGAYVGRFLGIDTSYFNVWSILAAIVGALIVLIIWCLIFRKNWR